MIYEHLAVKDGDTWSLAEVIASTDNEKAKVTVFEKVHPDGYDGYSLWKDVGDERTISRQSVLPIRPQTELVPALCSLSRSRRRIIVQVGNPEFIESMFIV